MISVRLIFSSIPPIDEKAYRILSKSDMPIFLIFLSLNLLLLNTKRLLLFMNHSTQLTVNHFSARLKFVMIVIFNTTTKIYKQTEQGICKHLMFKLLHIVQNILSIFITLLRRQITVTDLSRVATYLT